MFRSLKFVVSLVLIHLMSSLPLVHSLHLFLLRQIMFALRPINYLIAMKLSKGEKQQKSLANFAGRSKLANVPCLN